MEDGEDNKPDAKEGPQLVHVQRLLYISFFSRFTWTIVVYCWLYFTWWRSIVAFAEGYSSIHVRPKTKFVCKRVKSPLDCTKKVDKASQDLVETNNCCQKKHRKSILRLIWSFLAKRSKFEVQLIFKNFYPSKLIVTSQMIFSTIH